MEVDGHESPVVIHRREGCMLGSKSEENDLNVQLKRQYSVTVFREIIFFQNVIDKARREKEGEL